MSNKNIFLLLAGAGLLYWFYHKEKKDKTTKRKSLIPNDSTPLGYPQIINKPSPDFIIKVSGIKKHLTPHMI